MAFWIAVGKMFINVSPTNVPLVHPIIGMKMKPAKKIEFIERVAKTYLGLDGLQIVVNADKLSSRNVNNQDINFAEIGKKCLSEINGDYISKKYGLKEGISLAQKLHEERIKWLKNMETY